MSGHVKEIFDVIIGGAVGAILLITKLRKHGVLDILNE